ncbi:hypothetical protein AWENTII_012459 [Aspergillus wentii]|nr:hypothetical protein MW887_002734 [Aspergillus wentii]
MRKVPIPSNSPSLIPGSASGSTALGGQPMKPTTSTGSRAPTRLPSHQKDTLPQRTVGPRRASSNSTINQVKARGESTRNDTPTAEIKEPRWEGFAQRSSATHHAPAPAAPIRRSPTLEEDDMSSSSSGSESDEEEDGRRGHKFRHFGMYSIQKAGPRDDEDDDEEDSPAFLPFSHGTEHQARESSGQDLHETLRLNEQAGSQRRRMVERNPPPRTPVTESSTSSTSSGVPVSLPPSENRRRVHNFPSTLSPRRGPRLSPRRSVISGRETSDGTPSMGSSYSDLDDTSVTQSALEEALLSNMQHGGMASRMSTISQALRSRVLP